MPRVYTRKARKDYPGAGIKKGQTYYYWKFRYGGAWRSLSYPKPSQLTQSDYLQTVYQLEEELKNVAVNLEPDGDNVEVARLEELLTQIGDLRDEQENKRNNLPDSLQEVNTGQLLQERYDALSEAYNELE